MEERRKERKINIYISEKKTKTDPTSNEEDMEKKSKEKKKKNENKKCPPKKTEKLPPKRSTNPHVGLKAHLNDAAAG